MRTREVEGSCPISVVIPALNEEEEIGECLESMHQQSFPYFEVIVADNGSTDATASFFVRNGEV